MSFGYYINTKKDILEYLEEEGPTTREKLLCKIISIAPPDLIVEWLEELVNENKVKKTWPDTYELVGGII